MTKENIFVISVEAKEKVAQDDEIPFEMGRASLIHYLEHMTPEEWERGIVEVPEGTGPVGLLVLRMETK